MDCDIHLYTERKIKINRNGKEKDIWVNCDNYRINTWYYEYPEDERKFEIIPLYNDRNYSLFEVLANVRAYYGNEIMSEPKGLPDDISKEVQKEADYWSCDGHSYSWFTAKELFDYKKKHNTITYSGLLSQDQIKELDAGIYPTTWCQGCSDNTYERRTWTVEGCVLDNLINCIRERMCDLFNIYDFYNDDKKEEFINKYSEEFRIVFWFDN